MITGGAGFIGCNATQYFAKKSYEVFIIDNLCRETARVNLAWMRRNNVPFTFYQSDIRDKDAVEKIFKEQAVDCVLHLAAQVAVTCSVTDPRYDFEVNALGTFNILEAVRKHSPTAIFINASTNKVYGKIADKKVVEKEERYQYADATFQGVDETQQLDFYSPYGCSKGVADQYTLDYARIYGMKSVTVRQSCIYGPHQLGIEDQGWVAWFIIAQLLGKPITVYGNGKQVRDLLFVSDLVAYYDKIISSIDQVKGKAFNLGGGMRNALSLRQFFSILENISGVPVSYSTDKWRPGDQEMFVSNNARAEELLGFSPQVSCQEGIAKIFYWLKEYYQKDTIIAQNSFTENLLGQ